MRAKTLILFVIAVGCGLVASLGVSQYMERISGRGSPAAETVQVYVAVADINIGEKLCSENTKLVDWPKDRVLEGTIRELKDLENRYPRTRLYAGEAILKAKLMDSNDGSKAVDIPKGYRVVSAKVSMESSVSGLVQPGDKVDLVVFLRKGSDVPETATKTILRDVNVFAVDAETERKVDSNGQARSLRTVSLLVKPEQAEVVMLASVLGEMYLTLRRPDDDTEVVSEGVTIQSLLGGDSENASPKKSKANEQPAGPGFVQWLTNTATSAMQASQMAATTPPAEPVWTMQILTPDSCREFRWRNAAQLPEEVAREGSAPDAATPPVFDAGTPPVLAPETPVPPAEQATITTSTNAT